MASTEIDLKQNWACRGETLSGTRVVFADATVGATIIVPGSTKKQQAALAVTKSKTVAFYLYSNTEVTLAYNGVNEVQTVTISATGGTFTLTFGGYTTSAIAYNATASAVQTALQALTSIGSGNVTVSGSAGGPYTVTFVGDLGLTNVAQMTGSGASLTGGAGTVTIATTTGGAAPDDSWTLKAGQPEVWDSGGIFTNRMPGDLANVFITNSSTASAKVELRFGVTV